MLGHVALLTWESFPIHVGKAMLFLYDEQVPATEWQLCLGGSLKQ
jgi:hypothetical protein